MASNPPAACCAIGVKHEGEAKGQLQQIDDVEVYISRPERSTKRAILLLTDVIGHRFINAQLIADQLAANGYLVVMPDLFHGDPVPLNNRPASFDLMSWLKGPPGHLANRVEPVVQAILKEMKSNMGCERVGAVGYCFGVWFMSCIYFAATRVDRYRQNTPSDCSSQAFAMLLMWRTPVSSTQRNYKQSRARCLLLRLKPTQSSRPRSAMNPRISSPKLASRTRSTCSVALSMGLLSAQISPNRQSALLKSLPFYRQSHGLISTSNQSGRQISNMVTIKL